MSSSGGDGGGKVPAGALHAIQSRGRVAAFFSEVWRLYWRDQAPQETLVNGAPGLAFRQDGRVVGVLSIDADADGRCRRVFVVRSPEKLARLSPP